MRFDPPKPRLEGCPARLQGLMSAARGWVAERSKAHAWKVCIRQKRIVGSNPTPSARFMSRTGPSPENGFRFFEDFKGICEADRTSETEESPKIGL